MLTHLTIKNYALIKHLEMEPSHHLSVITGETGAGKSIMLGAIGLLLGNRADTKVLWDITEKCIIEGSFDIAPYKLESVFIEEALDYETQTVIRREIGSNGKSRAFINDTPVTLETMKKIGLRLMDVHSQHETLELGNRSFQLRLIDAFAGNQKLLLEYQAIWKNYNEAKVEYETLVSESKKLAQEADFVTFQLDELKKADLKESEQEKLESDLKVMENAEDIKTRFNLVIEQLGHSEFSVDSVLAEVRTQLNTVAAYSEAYAQLLKRIESLKIELDDILNEIEKEESKIEFDPEQINTVKERLSLIYQLLQKHRFQSTSQLLDLQESLQQRADKVSNLDEILSSAKKKLASLTNDLQHAAALLSKSREKVFIPLCKQLTHLLIELGIPNALLKVEKNKTEPTPTGVDSIELNFSANKGIAPRPLAQVASGGEFSRLMFSVKYVMAEKTYLPTMILDEIDSGVSGEIAIQLGKMMREMAKRHQIISISHLPQIAAKADVHFFVYKDDSSSKTVSLIKKLTEKERVTEIAKMIGGAKPSDMALENAKELIAR
ncbi:MAG: DNA repair protein RecN [Bacteroidia bacterium]|nr:DNA repair protein RecN [Bacteroidia bacterium]